RCHRRETLLRPRYHSVEQACCDSMLCIALEHSRAISRLWRWRSASACREAEDERDVGPRDWGRRATQSLMGHVSGTQRDRRLAPAESDEKLGTATLKSPEFSLKKQSSPALTWVLVLLSGTIG